jgi:predicted nuclease of predicted toxin-antitoxin system
VKLLLDEHYSPEIARQLRTRGHDVIAVAARADLTRLSDDELLRRMAQEPRTIMTNNVKDFMPLANRAAQGDDDHYGLLFTSDKGMPRRSDAIGRVVDALDAFLHRHQSEDSYRNRVQWLSASGRATANEDGSRCPAARVCPRRACRRPCRSHVRMKP